MSTNPINGIDLQDSFVLNWFVSDNEFVIDIEASILPASQYYSTPRENEYSCYKLAQLRFINCKTIHGVISKNGVRPYSDANGDLDYGNIDSLQTFSDGYIVEGNFGCVKIIGGEVVFRMRD